MHLSPAAYAIRVFGSAGALARVLGIYRQQPMRWRAHDGLIPTDKQRRLLDQARDRGLDLNERDVIYGRELPDGNALGIEPPSGAV